MRGPALDLRQKILDRIHGRPAAVWTPVDFLDLAPRASVDKALQRLAITGDLRRIDRGLYDHPRRNSLTGQPTAPDPRAVIDAVARRDQIRILIDGLSAANDLGLTTAVPARIIVLTDARARPIHLGNLEIHFKTVAPSRLYWAGRPAMRIVQALHWSKDLLATDRARIVARLRAVLADPIHGDRLRVDLHDGVHTLPAWMQPVVRDLVAMPTLAKDAPAPVTAGHHPGRPT
jgi:hypothetical protein